MIGRTRKAQSETENGKNREWKQKLKESNEKKQAEKEKRSLKGNKQMN